MAAERQTTWICVPTPKWEAERQSFTATRVMAGAEASRMGSPRMSHTVVVEVGVLDGGVLGGPVFGVVLGR